MTSTKQCYYLGANANGISILLIETEILPSDPDVTKGVCHLHGGLVPVDQTDVSGAVTYRTDASKPVRHLERMVRPDTSRHQVEVS